MKKADVKIGGKYDANVSGKSVVVQINAENPQGGWDATNLATGKKVRIKTAQRLQSIPAAKTTRSKPSSDEATRVDTEVKPNDNAPQLAPVPKKPVKAKTPAAATPESDATEEKLSCVTAALKVLTESSEPLSTKQMIEAMEVKGYWSSPSGKTPHATLYSAILRDLSKGEGSRFVKMDRGRFLARS